MLFRWLTIAGQVGVALVLATILNKKSPAFVPASLISMALAANAARQLRIVELTYTDKERVEDLTWVLKDSQAEEQLEYLGQAAESKIENERADKLMERQLAMLEATAPLFSQVLALTGKNGAIERMALGMVQDGASLGEVLKATADAELQWEAVKMHNAMQQEQIKANAFVASQKQQELLVATGQVQNKQQLSDFPDQRIALLNKSAEVSGVPTKLIRKDLAPSYTRYVCKLQTEDYEKFPKWKKAAQVALGVEDNLITYICGSEQIAFELPLPQSERRYFDFPVEYKWVEGERKILLGESLDGQVVVDLANDDTPQVLVAGTTGSGKSNFLRSAIYCLLRQGNRVEICGGKVSDYEDFTERFDAIQTHSMDCTPAFVKMFFDECGRRNGLSKAKLAQERPWILIIDEYKGAVPYEQSERKEFDQQICEVVRRGRGLKIHVIIGLQRGSKRTSDDPQGLPPDLRDNLPLRIAFRCTDAEGGRMILQRRGEVVTTLLGHGDGVAQSGQIDTRFQAYRFEQIPK